MHRTKRDDLPVAIIGAGPMGLATAAHLVALGESPVLFEAGESVGTSVRHWSHVRMFSPWSQLVDPVAGSLLQETNWVAPDPDEIPAGSDLILRYMEPLAELPAIAKGLRSRARVVGVTRVGHDRARSTLRESAPFELFVGEDSGRHRRTLARAVIDASGTYGAPNPLGANGLPAEGEHEHRERIYYGIPDLLGRDRPRYEGKTTLVVGGGHSAFHVVIGLGELHQARGIWATRGAGQSPKPAAHTTDDLPERARLEERAADLVARGLVELVSGIHVRRVFAVGSELVVEGLESRLPPVDEIVVTTGYRPDLSFVREIRMDLDPSLEAPRRLAPLIDPSRHDCRSVPSHGADELSHPEPGFFTVGMKSYGRAPTFLLSTGYDQVRSVVSLLTGRKAADLGSPVAAPAAGSDCAHLPGPSCCGPRTIHPGPYDLSGTRRG